jgi:hypothetical protein
MSLNIKKDNILNQSLSLESVGVLNMYNLSYLLVGILFLGFFVVNLDVEGIIIIDVFLIISTLYILFAKQTYLYVLSNKNQIVASVFNYFILYQQICLSICLFVLQAKIEFFF